MKTGWKKALALLVILALAASLMAGAVIADEEETLLAEIVNTRTPLTDASFDRYFEGSAEAGIKKLLDEGKVYINGRQVPYVLENGEYSADKLLVNGFPALEPSTDGGWRYDLHASVRGNVTEGTERENFETARFEMVKGATMLVGFKTELYAAPGSNTASRIAFTIKSSAQVTEVAEDGGNMIIRGTEHDATHGYGTLTADTFPKANVTGDIKAEDVVLFWQDERDGDAGWNVERAECVRGYLTGSREGAEALDLYFTFDGEEVLQAVLRRDGLATPVRPTQFYEAHIADGRQDEQVNMWTTETGNVVAFSYVTVDKSGLAAALADAETVLNGIAVSEDGEDVWATQKWMKDAVLRVMNQMLDGARAVYADPAATQEAVDEQVAMAMRVAQAVPYQASDGKREPFDAAKQGVIKTEIFNQSDIFKEAGTDGAGLTMIGGPVAGGTKAGATTAQNLVDDFVASAANAEDLVGLVAVYSGDTAASASAALGTGMTAEIETGGDPMKMTVVVTNDLNGDGIVNLDDLTALAREIQTPGSLNAAQRAAAAIPTTNDGDTLNLLSALIRMAKASQ